MAIEFGIWDHFERREGVPVKQQFEERIEYVQEAERLGFNGYHVAEHHLTPLDLAPSQTVFLSMLARETSTIRIGTMVFCLPLYHPLRLIQEIAMVDNISDGRLMVGVGRGIRDNEHEWWGLDHGEARERYTETLDIIIDAFTKKRIDHHGKFYNFDDLPVDVLPVQQPYPEMWYTAKTEYAARNAMSCLGGAGFPMSREQVDQYWQLWEEGKRTGDQRLAWNRTPRIGTTRHTIIADTDEEALAIAERAWGQYRRNFFATPIFAGEPPPGFDPTGGSAKEAVLYGSPATVRDHLVEYVKTMGPGFNFLSGAFHWGDITPAEATRSLRYFSQEIMPAVREASAVPA